MTEREFSTEETDWVANSYLGYGFGYTKAQALQTMAANVSSASSDIPVDLIEHVGKATVSARGTNVEHFVHGERIEIPEEDFNKLRDYAIRAEVESTNIVDDPENFVEEIKNE